MEAILRMRSRRTSSKCGARRCVAILIIAALVVLVGCQIPPKFVSYRPPGEDKNLGIEVFFRTGLIPTGVHPSAELRVNGVFVAKMEWTVISNDHPQASGTYLGKRIEMRGDVSGQGLSVDVYVNGEHAAHFQSH